MVINFLIARKSSFSHQQASSDAMMARMMMNDDGSHTRYIPSAPTPNSAALKMLFLLWASGCRLFSLIC